MPEVIEDPFDQVANDTQEQLDRLKHYLTSHGRDDEVLDILKDVKDTMVDLERSIVVMKRSGQDVSSREEKLAHIRRDLESIDSIKKPSATTTQSGQTVPLLEEELGAKAFEDNNGGQDPSGGMANPFQEQLLREQDSHLDDIHKTMQNLHLHAQTMGQELEDQGQILDELDENFDSITNKVQRGRRQLEWIYEKNKEKYNDCCIGLLIIALIVLLVLAFIA
ncbi:similar to Saccharomyces cerevisiae YDR468C TLG1 Essential t-SNARE that forms a complex with Tlg2p and Vti1p and mediates fusion of endosome-derived vesicles with the late Golgi [Maudiozyma saulgeensis]|uniref:t-SNARE affecting a late Golgi compartment protein 1 n=1 Tax=Maudiozyma saulgeensis TaxID=1789683 RepID=A0A1X7R9E5_9SACH|nr:similar to Saccharomyces cerevisiae YDR468C TLG1 Essential t-SNARE that forms a complex with Tlg2p and Vti1p and mediates fusion of endosome-derived vesicles with the late Golgi [Kazachstania saulgeensis]